LLGIAPAALMLLPLHVVLLELVIDPTCSIVLERQPAEQDIMDRPPRRTNERLLNPGILLKSCIQGLVICAASFGAYFSFLSGHPAQANTARSMGLAVILLSNLLLVQVNSSNTELAIRTFLRLWRDKVMWAVTAGTLAGLILMLYTPINGFLKLAALDIGQLFTTIGIAVIAVGWYEIVKIIRKIGSRKKV
jgi:P-type Ca2+ transporter type 2C